MENGLFIGRIKDGDMGQRWHPTLKLGRTRKSHPDDEAFVANPGETTIKE